MAPLRCVGFSADRRAPSCWGALGASLATFAVALSLLATTALAASQRRGTARVHSGTPGVPGQLASTNEQPTPAAPAVMTPPAQTMPPGASLPAAAEEPSPEPVVLEGGISVAVGNDQHATVLGEAQSVKALVEEICRQAHIDLRTYAAPDRRYVGKLDNVPLSEALRSILRSESYLLGFRADTNGGPARVTWMRVLGGQPGAKNAVAAMQPAAAQFVQPSPMKSPRHPLRGSRCPPRSCSRRLGPSIPFVVTRRNAKCSTESISPTSCNGFS